MIEIWQEELREGSEKALQEVFSEYYTQLCAIAYQYVGDMQVSESIAEECFVSLWEKREQILPLDNFRLYISRMVRNRSIDYLRAQRVTTVDFDSPSDSCFISDSDLFEELVTKDLQQIIHDTLQSLSPQCRKIFELSREENLSYREIAQRLNISENTVKYHIKQALAALRDALSLYTAVLLPFISAVFPASHQ